MLSEADKRKLSHELTPVTAEGFMQNISSKVAYDALFQDVFNHVVPCDRLTIYRKQFENEPTAFIAASLKEFEEERLYHLEGIIVAPNMHGTSFAYQILERELLECGADILTFHTQSMLMEGLGRKISIFDVDLARRVATFVGTRNLLDLPSGPIDKARYGGNCLYGDIERFDPIAIKQTGFDYLKGDAIVFAGRIKRK